MTDPKHASLVHLDRVRYELDMATNVLEVKDVRDKAEALRIYAKQSGSGLAAQNACAEVKLLAERRAGQLIAEMQEAGDLASRGRPSKNLQPVSFSEAGISHADSARWQAIASIKEEKFRREIVAVKEAGEELTSAGMRRLARNPHVANNSVCNEWYTPPEFIEAARKTMGGIDLDPASCPEANEVVKAEAIYTKDDDGLTKEWNGRVWLNPPYAAALVGKFATKLLFGLEAGTVTQACVLVNNGTETAWFQAMARFASCICFPAGRVKFWRPGGDTGSPLQGQAILYFGPNWEAFDEAFSFAGIVLSRGAR
jgi:ParB family chromosome partitioning protein